MCCVDAEWNRKYKTQKKGKLNSNSKQRANHAQREGKTHES